MANINLLDWREEQRQTRQKEFFVTLGLMAVLALLIWGLVHVVMNKRIDAQQANNDYLQEQIRSLDRQIKEINELEKQREELINRMNVIQDLQQSRPEIVRVFDELVRIVPEGIHLQSWERKNDALLTFNARAESNPRISEFMRKMDRSVRLQSKALKEVEQETKGVPVQVFVLNGMQINPNKTPEDEQGGQ